MFDVLNASQIVSIHAPVSERRSARKRIKSFCRFNSRSCEGATKRFKYFYLARRVSIHAPVRERQVEQMRGINYAKFQFTLP